MSLLLNFCIIVSVFSQIEPLEKVLRPIMYASWAITCVYSIFAHKGKLSISRFTSYYLFIYVLFLLFSFICSLFGTNHLESSYLKLLSIPLMICFVADNCASSITNIKFQHLLKNYLWVTLIFALWAHFSYFSSYTDWLISNIYNFDQKNSAAQIFGSAILVNIFLISYKSKLGRGLGILLNGYLLWLILLSQCRTALLGLCIVWAFNIVFYSKNKLLWIILGIVGLYFLAVTSVLHDTINHSLQLTKYTGTDLNTLSSGRLDFYKIAWHNFLSSPLIGLGRYYVDCSYLSVLTENGIIGFIFIESIWFYKIILHIATNFKNIHAKYSNTSQFLFSITIFYIVESLLEGYPPFGPGVSALAFWLFSQILLKRNDLLKNNVILQTSTRNQ